MSLYFSAGHAAVHDCRCYVRSNDCSLPEQPLKNIFFIKTLTEDEKVNTHSIIPVRISQAKKEHNRNIWNLKHTYLKLDKQWKYVTQCAWAQFTKPQFPLEKEALHETEVNCVGSLDFIIVLNFFIILFPGMPCFSLT